MRYVPQLPSGREVASCRVWRVRGTKSSRVAGGSCRALHMSVAGRRRRRGRSSDFSGSTRRVDFIRGEGWTLQRGDKQSRRDECAAPNDTQRRRCGRGNCAVASVCPLRACDNDSRQPAAAPARASFRRCHLVMDAGVDGRPKARAPPPPLWRVKSFHDLGKWSCQCEIGFGCVSPYRARGGLRRKALKRLNAHLVQFIG